MRTLPNVYSQRDPKWSSQRLGTVNGTTIGGYGCKDTCFAMKAGYYGHTINPSELDNNFTDKKIYVSGNLLNDDALSKVFSDCQFVQTLEYKAVPADLNKLKDLLSDPSITVTLEVDFNHNPSDGTQMHFVEAIDCDGTNVTIADPWYGSIDPFSKNYGTSPKTTILKFIVYKGKPVGQGVLVDADTFGHLVDKSTKFDAFVAAGFSNVNDVQQALQSKQSTIDNLNQQVTSLNQQIATLSGDSHSKDTTIEQLKGEIETLKPITDQVPDLKKQLDVAIEDRSNYMKQVDALTRTNTGLKKTSYSTAELKVLISELLSRLGNKLVNKN